MADTINYTVVGNPTISSDYILTDTSNGNYLTFNPGTLDTTKDFDVICKCTINSYAPQRMGFFSLGGGVELRYYNGMLFCYVGTNYQYIQMEDYPYTKYIKYSYMANYGSNGRCLIYLSDDGENWEDAGYLYLYDPLTLTDTNTLGKGDAYYISSTYGSFDVSEFKIYSDGDLWYEAITRSYDPYIDVEAINLSKTVFTGNSNIHTINLCNTPFVNGDMSSAFRNCTNLVNISNMNQNVTNMAYTFAGLPTSFYQYNFPTIPNSVTNIAGLFADHPTWTDIPVDAFVNAWSKLPAALQNNMSDFLEGCSNLANIPSNVLPNFVTNISGAFRNCAKMTDMPIITENVQDMSYTFTGCYRLVNLNYSIPNSVTNMSNAFKGCYSFTNGPDMSTATNVVNMDSAFTDCSNLTTINGLSSCTNVKNMYYTFLDCGKMVTAPVLPDSVTNMNETFCQCYHLTTVPHLPNSVTDMDSAFMSCSNMLDAPDFTNCTNLVNMDHVFMQCYNLVNGPTVIPNSVTSMVGTFSKCYNMVSGPVAIPDSVLNMYMTFVWDNSITSAPTIGNNVESVSWAFRGCSNLTSAPNIPASVTNMYYTFGDCVNITGNIYIHSNNISSASSCFYNTSAQKNVYIPFKYSNGVNSKTYNSFISAGYKTDGSVCGVYLKNLAS